jgi:hypothetical protein
MSAKIIAIIFIVGILALGIGGFFLLKKDNTNQAQNEQNSTDKAVTTQNPTNSTSEHYIANVELTPSGFSEPTLNEKQGVIVQIKNSTDSLVSLSGGQTKFDIAAGKTYSLNFDSPGTFKYINAAKKDQSISITVK